MWLLLLVGAAALLYYYFTGTPVLADTTVKDIFDMRETQTQTQTQTQAQAPTYIQPQALPEWDADPYPEPVPVQVQVPVSDQVPVLRQLHATDPPADAQEIEQISDRVKYEPLLMPYDVPSSSRMGMRPPPTQGTADPRSSSSAGRSFAPASVRRGGGGGRF